MYCFHDWILLLKEVDEEDCYAEILKDDIIKLDESSLSSQEGHNELRDHTMIPSQGTAQRRIRLRVEKAKKKKQSLASGVRFPSSMHSSKRRPLLGTLTTSRFMLLSLFFVLTLIALYLLSLLVVGNLKQVKSCGKFGFGCKLWVERCIYIYCKFRPTYLGSFPYIIHYPSNFWAKS